MFQIIKFPFKRIKFSFDTSKSYLTESSYCYKLVISVVHRRNIAIRDLIRNNDGNGVVMKAIGLISKPITLHVHHPFLYISLLSPCTTATWNDQIFSLLENRNGKVINSNISLRTRARSVLFSSNLNSLLLSNWVTWHIRETRGRMRSLSLGQHTSQEERWDICVMWRSVRAIIS